MIACRRWLYVRISDFARYLGRGYILGHDQDPSFLFTLFVIGSTEGFHEAPLQSHYRAIRLVGLQTPTNSPLDALQDLGVKLV